MWRRMQVQPHLATSEGASLLGCCSCSALNPSLSVGNIVHLQGHVDRAAAVNAVSRQFDSVRVEQNHCHGLHVVNANCNR